MPEQDNNVIKMQFAAIYSQQQLRVPLCACVQVRVYVFVSLYVSE